MAEAIPNESIETGGQSASHLEDSVSDAELSMPVLREEWPFCEIQRPDPRRFSAALSEQ